MPSGTLSLYDVMGITLHLHIKLQSFSNIAQPLYKETVRGCSFLYIIAKKSVIISEAFLVDVSIVESHGFYANASLWSQVLCRKYNIFKYLGEYAAKL